MRNLWGRSTLATILSRSVPDGQSLRMESNCHCISRRQEVIQVHRSRRPLLDTGAVEHISRSCMLWGTLSRSSRWALTALTAFLARHGSFYWRASSGTLRLSDHFAISSLSTPYIVQSNQLTAFPRNPLENLEKEKGRSEIYVTVQRRNIGEINISSPGFWSHFTFDRPCEDDYHLAEMKIPPKVRCNQI
jgi:hypothetical protein